MDIVRVYDEILIEEEEISLLESYFCKPNELDIVKTSSDCIIRLKSEIENSNINCKLETQLCLIHKDGCYFMSSNPAHLSFNELDRNINKKQLQHFKDHVLDHEQILFHNEEFSLFGFLTWITSEIEKFVKSVWFPLGYIQVNPGIEIEDSLVCLCGLLIKLDHIRSTSRYYKFFKETSFQLNINVKLLRCGKFIYILVFGNNVSVKEYIKLHKTSLVDVDSNGKPCKERMLQIKSKKVIDKEIGDNYDLCTAGFEVVEIVNYIELEKQLGIFSFSLADV